MDCISVTAAVSVGGFFFLVGCSLGIITGVCVQSKDE